MAKKENNITRVLKRRVEKILPSKEELGKLMKKRKLRLYQGIDPTGKRLHLGHSIGLRKLMEFAELGHEVILLFGTGTVLVGDPSQRETGRRQITKEEIEKNIKDWKEQASSIVDFSKVKVLQNADWLLKLTLEDIINIGSNISAIQLFKRDSFQRRLDGGDTVWYHETMYPLLQGYDSVVMDVDLEIGGTDQEFNMLIGRELQKKINNKEKFVLTLPMIMGTDGKTMSKSSGNCVWLNDKPDEMFGKLMSIGDEQIVPYFELATNIPDDKLKKLKKEIKSGELSPLDAKKLLAETVVNELHSKDQAVKAKKNFEKTFQKGDPEYKKKHRIKEGSTILDVVSDFADSNSQAKRLISQGGVDINEERVKDPTTKLDGGEKVRIGKKTYITIVKNE